MGKTYKKWTEAEKNFISSHIDTLTDAELSAKLSQMTNEVISISMIRRQRRRLGIKKAQGRPFRKVDESQSNGSEG